MGRGGIYLSPSLVCLNVHLDQISCVLFITKCCCIISGCPCRRLLSPPVDGGEKRGDDGGWDVRRRDMYLLSYSQWKFRFRRKVEERGRERERERSRRGAKKECVFTWVSILVRTSLALTPYISLKWCERGYCSPSLSDTPSKGCFPALWQGTQKPFSDMTSG